MKLPHRTNHDDDDDGDYARSSTQLLGQLYLCQCLNVSNRLDSGNHKTSYAHAACVWQGCQFQKAKKSNFKQSQHKRILEVRLVIFSCLE